MMSSAKLALTGDYAHDRIVGEMAILRKSSCWDTASF